MLIVFFRSPSTPTERPAPRRRRARPQSAPPPRGGPLASGESRVTRIGKPMFRTSISFPGFKADNVGEITLVSLKKR
jgi:hypothetical protein